nr:capsid protein [Cressdnaviricota sp.]
MRRTARFQPRRMPYAARRQLTLYRNPFSIATNDPKIPDGKASLSCGQRFQCIKNAELPTDGSPLLIILYPGFGGGLYLDDGTSTQHCTLTGDHGSWDYASSKYTQHAGVHGISHWRMVSQGVKITLLNNADENDGYFETARITVNRDPKYWYFDFKDGETTGPNTMLPTSQHFDVELDKLVEHPTYRTGKLRDIHKFQFVNSPEVGEHDFIDVNDEYSKEVGVSLNSSDIPLVNANLDNTWDMVLILLHGRSSVSSPSRTLFHYVQNQEVVYENNSDFARFHTSTARPTSRMPATAFGIGRSLRTYRRSGRRLVRRYRRYRRYRR